MVTRYIDLTTNTVINQNSIVTNNSNGIVCFIDNIWKFIPKDRIRVEQVNNINDPVRSITQKISKATTVNTALEPDADNIITDTFYCYYFGLTEANASKRKYHENSAFVSDAIQVEQGYTYSLLADYTQPDKTSIEFYILDGIKEVPILPLGNTSIQNEKVFSGTPLRFNAKDTVVLSRNFSVITDTIDTVDLSLNSLVTANYTASEDAQYITVSNSTVRIKAILRCYNGATVPPMIKSLMLQKGE